MTRARARMVDVSNRPEPVCALGVRYPKARSVCTGLWQGYLEAPPWVRTQYDA